MRHYYSSNKAHIFWDEVVESVVISWNSFANGNEFREPLDKMIELAVIKKAKKALFDSSHILVLAEDTKWLSEQWLPRLLNAGIKYTATVNPTRSDTNSGIKNTTTGKDTTKLLHHEFMDIQKAVAWLSGIAA
ncbi:hypothetical protein ACFPYJ_15600 [Paenibacillus solisilvae]|uniref:STAS/SEC14 domain-containing protein n=1 Tax=Paenibacillus solisilvae TaxID=2486751 RepID=A0ABW0W274_9BACL